MSPLSAEFQAAYDDATRKIMDAVCEFERATGRTADGISLDRIDVTTLRSNARELIRQGRLRSTSCRLLRKWAELRTRMYPQSMV